MQGAVRSGLVRKDDVRFPLNWYVEKRLCPHKKLLLAYIAENSTDESRQFLESLDAWQRCPSYGRTVAKLGAHRGGSRELRVAGILRGLERAVDGTTAPDALISQT